MITRAGACSEASVLWGSQEDIFCPCESFTCASQGNTCASPSFTCSPQGFVQLQKVVMATQSMCLRCFNKMTLTINDKNPTQYFRLPQILIHLRVWELMPLAMLMICRTFISQTSNSSSSGSRQAREELKKRKIIYIQFPR